MAVFVQFSDSSETTVVAVFGCPQDPEIQSNQGAVGEDDPRYIAFIAPPVVEVVTAPLDKLKAFLTDNPDVAAILK